MNTCKHVDKSKNVSAKDDTHKIECERSDVLGVDLFRIDSLECIHKDVLLISVTNNMEYEIWYTEEEEMETQQKKKMIISFSTST